MAIRTLDPVVVSSAAGNVDFSALVANLGTPCEVKIANESPYALIVTIDADQHGLPAWTADKFSLCGKTAFAYAPTLLGSAVNPPSASLVVTIATGTSAIPGTYPAPLTRQLSSVKLAQRLGTMTVTGQGNVLSQDFTVPIGTAAVGVILHESNTWSDIEVNGKSSGNPITNTQLAANLGLPGGLRVGYWPSSPDIDTQVTVIALLTTAAQGAGSHLLDVVALPWPINTGSVPTSSDFSGQIAGLSTPPVAGLGYLWNPVSGNWERLRTPTGGASATATDTGLVVIWTPAAGKRFRLMAYVLIVTSEAVLTAAGRINIALYDMAVPIPLGGGLAHGVFIGGAAGPIGPPLLYAYEVLPGNGYLSRQADNSLQMYLTNSTGTLPLIAGSVRLTAIGTEE